MSKAVEKGWAGTDLMGRSSFGPEFYVIPFYALMKEDLKQSRLTSHSLYNRG